MQEIRSKESNYYAFGSDDMFQSERPQKKSLSDRMEGGKQVFSKIGTFFGNSVRSIVKMKDAEPSDEDNRVKREEDTEDNARGKNKLKDIGKDIKHISSKIGDGIFNIGSKTKNLASQTGTFLKQKTNTLFNAKDESEIKDEISKNSNRYQEYFDEEGPGGDQKSEESTTRGKRDPETDVHFI